MGHSVPIDPSFSDQKRRSTLFIPVCGRNIVLVTKAGEISYSMQTGQGKGNSLRDEGRRKGTFYAMRIGERAECMWWGQEKWKNECMDGRIYAMKERGRIQCMQWERVQFMWWWQEKGQNLFSKGRRKRSQLAQGGQERRHTLGHNLWDENRAGERVKYSRQVLNRARERVLFV